MKKFLSKLLKKQVSNCNLLREWRKIHLLGMADLRGRFARSKLGQFWVSVSMLCNICIVGVVWSFIWKMPISKYLPYVGMGHIIFSFASQTINESCGIYIANARIYTNQSLPLSISVFAHIYKHTIIVLYNIPIFILLFVFSNYTTLNMTFSFPLGILASLCFITLSSYMLSIICVKFRDLIQVIGVLMQASFLVTPVMWEVSIIPANLYKYVYINPFACIVEILRNPFLNIDTPIYALFSLCIWSLLLLVINFFLYKKFSRNLVFWM